MNANANVVKKMPVLTSHVNQELIDLVDEYIKKVKEKRGHTLTRSGVIKDLLEEIIPERLKELEG